MIATASYGILPNFELLRDRAEIVAIADPLIDRARAVANDYGIAAWYPSLAEMLVDADLDAVVNLTPIPVHYETSLAILEAGKHLVTEKPLATTLEEADELCDAADRRGLTIVAAPPSMLSREILTAKHMVLEGAIGRVAFARVHSSHAGAAAYGWPTDPTWLYSAGSGPLLDMGVYGIHEITGILGPAKRVVAYSGLTSSTRSVRGGPFAGMEIDVTADDNVLLMLDFGNAIFAVVDATFNMLAARGPHLELYGSEGTLNVYQPLPDEDFAPSIELFRREALAGMSGWIRPVLSESVFIPDRVAALERAVLIDHLIDCLRDGTRPILGADHARHALEIMLKAQVSAREGVVMSLSTTFANE